MPYVAPGFVLSLPLSDFFPILGKFYSGLLGSPEARTEYPTALHIKLSVLTMFSLLSLGIISACGAELLKLLARYIQRRRRKEKYDEALVKYFKGLYFLEPNRYEYARALSQKSSYISSMAFALLVNLIFAVCRDRPQSHVVIVGAFFLVCALVSYYLVIFETHIFRALASMGEAASSKGDAQPPATGDAPQAARP